MITLHSMPVGSLGRQLWCPSSADIVTQHWFAEMPYYCSCLSNRWRIAGLIDCKSLTIDLLTVCLMTIDMSCGTTQMTSIIFSGPLKKAAFRGAKKKRIASSNRKYPCIKWKRGYSSYRGGVFLG